MKQPWTSYYLFVLSVITGISIVFAAVSYTRYIERIDANRLAAPARVSKTVQILSVDAATKTVRAKILDTPLGDANEVTFSITDQSVIEQRDPILLDGAVRGLRAPLPAHFDHVQRGGIAFVRLSVEETGLLRARYILLNDPISTAD